MNKTSIRKDWKLIESLIQEKSKILQKLDKVVPKISNKDSEDSESSTKQTDLQFGGFASKQDYINYAINMGMKGDMDYVNAIPEKTIRGMAKAGMVKSKRTGELPPLPEKVEGGSGKCCDAYHF